MSCGRENENNDDGMEFDQIPLLPPLLAAVYAVPRQPAPRGIAFHHFVPAPAPCPSQVLFGRRFSSITYSLSKLDDLLALLFGETLHSSLARARERE